MLVTLVFLTSSKLPAPIRVASQPPEALKSRITIPTEQPAYVFAQSGGTTLRKSFSESSFGEQQTKATNPPLVEEVAEPHGSIRSRHAKGVSNGPPQSPGFGAANQEDDSVEVPGKVLKELVPGYETREIQGFKMLLSTQAIKEGKKDKGKPFQALLTEFDGLAEVLPSSTLKPLRRVLIWIEWDNLDWANPRTLAKYYGGSIWSLAPSEHPLKSNAIELLSLKKLTVEKNLSTERTRLVLLHELAHAVHHVVVGFDNRDVLFAYKQAMDRRLYDRVQTENGGLERAYAATNAREYFAELTCAYLDRCYYFPFTREDLRDHDPTGYRLMESVWGKQKEEPRKAGPGAREERIRNMIERYIRADIPNRSLRLDHWHPPLRASDGQKEGLLYRIEFSISVVNLRDANIERRNSNYCVFVVNERIMTKQITPAGWKAVKICKILEKE
jgi:hypothetical protein